MPEAPNRFAGATAVGKVSARTGGVPPRRYPELHEVAAEETPDDRDAGVLDGLLSPFRLPERALRGIESLAGAAGHLAPIREEITRLRESLGPLPDLIERTRKQTESVPQMLPTVERISEQARPLAEVLPALESLEKSMAARLEALHAVIVNLEGDESHLNKAVVGLGREIEEMHKTIHALQEDVQRITDRLPDPSKGPLEKARDVLTGSSE
jgi:prefoldin subunit 5